LRRRFIYQFCLPIFPLLLINAGIWYLYQILQVSIWIRITLAPLGVLANYFGYICIMTIFCRWLNNFFQKLSPAKEGVFSRRFTKHNVADRSLQYYHLRGFMFKFPVWVAKKSCFPWLITWVLRTMAYNEIHPDAFYGDCYVSLEFTQLAEGTIIQEGVAISSHVIDSIFGNLTIEKVTLEKNAVLTANAVMAPGSIIKEGMSVGPKSMVPKRWKIHHPANQFIWGVPAKNAYYQSFLDLLPPTFQTQWKEKQAEKK